MGIFSFLADAGETLGLTSGDDAQSSNNAITQQITENGLQVDNLQATINGNTVTLQGDASSQADREKAVLLAGNVTGIAQVDDQLTVQAANDDTNQQQEQATFYTVQSGDTLSKIAQQFYGNANAYNMIFQANKPMLKSADALYPGQTLRIPTAGQQAA